MTKVKQKAGLIPFYKNGDDILMLFMKPSDSKYGGKTFQIAKGGVDDNENPLETAVRESGEELGLRDSNIKWVRKCGVFLGNHHIYMAEVHTMNSENFNKPTFETEETKWMTLDEISANGRELHKKIIKKCYDQFKQTLSDS